MGALTGDPADLGRRLAALDTMTADTALPDGTRSPRSGLLMIRGLVGSDGPTGCSSTPQDALALESNPVSPGMRVAQAGLGHAPFVTGDRRLARHHLAVAAAAPHVPRAIRILAYAVLSLCEAEQGDLAASRRDAEQAMAAVTDHAMPTHLSVLPAYTATGVALAGQGHLPAAMATLEAGLRSARRAPGLSPWPLIHHLIAMATLTARMGDSVDRADLLLAEVATLTPWTDASMAATRTRAAAREHLPAAPVVRESLTTRERDILLRLRGHQTLREIAGDLQVSYNTVKTITCPRSSSSAPTPAPKQSPSSNSNTHRRPTTNCARCPPPSTGSSTALSSPAETRVLEDRSTVSTAFHKGAIGDPGCSTQRYPGGRDVADRTTGARVCSDAEPRRPR